MIADSPLGLTRHPRFDEYCHYERPNTMIFARDQHEPREVELRRLSHIGLLTR